MAFGVCFCIALLQFAWFPAKSENVPEGVHQMECYDRYFMIAVDLSFTGVESRFEAVDGPDVYPITEQYSAECGYAVSVLPLPGHVELRASYFSCHAENNDDEVFTFNFNLIANHEGKEVTYTLNKTCSSSLPWSPREVTCEVNYMEVSVMGEVACPSGKKRDNPIADKPAKASAASDWQVMFQRAGEQLMSMNLSEARKQGYVFDLTDRRLVFRTPYGKADSFREEVNGVPVEVVHATLFSRQSWMVLVVDLVAACSMHQGSYDNHGYMIWQTPEVLHPLVSGLNQTSVTLGLYGELLEQPVAEERGYIVERHNATVEISIPYNAEGGYRKSFVTGGLREFYVFNLYLEQTLVDETRLRFHRTLATPLLLRRVFIINGTIPEEQMFTIHLGDIPEDIELAAVQLNGQEFSVPFTNASSCTVTKVVHPNNTHGYTLKVPFNDSYVIHQFSKEDEAMKHMLDINYTLTILPENEPYYHLASVMALTDVSPPQFDVVCSNTGIHFKLDHRPFDYMWYINIGSDLLTPELAAQHSYIMSNNSWSLMLEVPLFTHGYEYKDISLKGFLGTFEILIRDHETSEVQRSTIKTCPFASTELIMCSTDGRMTVVANLSLAISSGGSRARTNLNDKYCGPKEADDTRALFSFPLNSCGSTVRLGRETVTYQNEIFFSKKQQSVSKAASEEITDRVTVQCTYPLAGLHRLFSVYRFESDSAGVGSIIHTTLSTAGAPGPQVPTTKPTTVLQTTLATKRPNPTLAFQPAFHPPARYIKVPAFRRFRGMRKGAAGILRTKVNSVQI